MSFSQDPLGSLLQALHKQAKGERFSSVDIERYDRWWLKIDLKEENRLLWIGHEANNGFFITLDQGLLPESYFRLDSKLNQTADLILDGLLPPVTSEAVITKVEEEIQRLQSKIKIHKRTVGNGSSVVLIQLELSDDSQGIATKLVQHGDFQKFPVKANVTLELGGQKAQKAPFVIEEKRGLASQFLEVLSRVSFIYRFLKFIFKPFKLLLAPQSIERLSTSIDRDMSGLQSALKILSNPAFKKAICGSISDDLDLIFKKIVDIGIPTGIIAATGAMAMSVYGVSITPTGIALIALIISRASIKVYCNPGKS